MCMCWKGVSLYDMQGDCYNLDHGFSEFWGQ